MKYLLACFFLTTMLFPDRKKNDTGSAIPKLGNGIHVTDTGDFVCWQLKSSSNTIGMSYVFKMNNGDVVVLDGGWPLTRNKDAVMLRNKIAELGDTVAAWFLSHPHPDHAGALYSILEDPGNIKIKNIYYSRLTPNLVQLEKSNRAFCKSFYKRLDSASALYGIRVVNFTKPGEVITIDETHFKILSVRNPEITKSPYNNSSMAIRVWDNEKSIVFLGDLHILGGNKLLHGPYKDDLDCDYLQMAHHGNAGAGFDFYRDIKFSYCLWPTPSWLWDNNVGKGFNTGPYNTVDYRNLVDSLGVKKNYVAWKGTVEIK